ncbi:MAG: WWE domain-containing protein, partial [Deltaproteobacteria bacterium]|nr:WWE domain-containing protein [Deltaproteobacteria bacterium]
HTRFGYSRLRLVNFDVEQQDILAGIAYCGGGLTPTILDALDNFLMGFLFNFLVGSFTGPLEDALCQQANPEIDPPCPDGAFDVEGICRYGPLATDECAGSVLGIDGNIDLAGLLGGAGLGASGALDFLFAAGGQSTRPDGSGHHYGDLNPIGQGATVAMMGAAEPTPVSACVPEFNAQVPGNIPIPDELLANTLSDWPSNLDGPHFGFALSERYLNYALAQLYNSGALCMGITADTLGDAVPLTTSLVGLGLGLPEPRNSMEELGLQKRAAPLAIMLRPHSPPVIEIGEGTHPLTDPLLHLTLNEVSLDFYVWSLDRYIRVMTATMDLSVPINLDVSSEGLQPVIEEIGIANVTVDNAELLRQEPALIGTALQDLLGGLVGDFVGGALAPIDVNGLLSGLGLSLEIPPSGQGTPSPGLRKLTKDSDDFLGIFATLGIADPVNSVNGAAQTRLPPVRSETSATLVDVEVHPTSLRFDGTAFGPAPLATLRVGSSLDDGTQTIEWQYRLDRGPWHPFTSERYLKVDDSYLRLQGRHVVQVRSRVVGDPYSMDLEPAEVVVIIDDEAPRVAVIEDQAGRVTIAVNDTVSGEARTQVRLRLGDWAGGEIEWTPWSVWQPADELAPLEVDGAVFIEVEAQDEDGNIGTVTQELIRGRGAADGGGCECRATGHPPDGSGWLPWLLAAGLGLVVGARRRRRGTEQDH